MLTPVIADWTAPVGAVASGVAAVAAVVAIAQAKQAARASRDAVTEERRLRIEESYRALGRGLVMVNDAARRARELPNAASALERLRDEQTVLRAMGTMPLWVDLPADSLPLMDTAVSLTSNPKEVVRAASVLIAQLQDAWDGRPELALPSIDADRRPRGLRERIRAERAGGYRGLF